MKSLPLAILCLVFASCGGEKNVNGLCGAYPKTDSLSALERQVLEDALQRNAKECGPSSSNCILSLQDNEKFLVRVQMKVFDPKKNVCVAIIGGTWFEKYRNDGSHEDTLRGF